MLGDVLSEKKKLSPQRISAVSERLLLSDDERLMGRLIFDYEHACESLTRELLAPEIAKLLATRAKDLL